MKNLWILLLLLSTMVAAQNTSVIYHYDGMGNRISRTYGEVVMNKSATVGKSAQVPNDLNDTTVYQSKERIEILEENQRFIIYPNPTYGLVEFEISSYSDEFKRAKLTVTDMSGKVLVRQRVKSNRTPLDLTKMKTGTYILIFEADNMQRNWKLIKK